MPPKPLRPCRQPGCPSLIRGGGWCEAHKPVSWASTTASAASRGYGSQWRALRERVLRRDPTCYRCRREPSTAVDHVRPKAQGGSDDLSNLAGICEGCHTRKTAGEAQAGLKRSRPR